MAGVERHRSEVFVSFPFVHGLVRRETGLVLEQAARVILGKPTDQKRMQTDHQLLADLYTAFNAREIDRCLTAMLPDVTWANGVDGGYVHGHEAVREYWTRQWKLVNPRVEPVHFDSQGGRIVVDVHQVVRALDGSILLDRIVKHIFTLEGGLVKVFEIADPK